MSDHVGLFIFFLCYTSNIHINLLFILELMLKFGVNVDRDFNEQPTKVWNYVKN